MERRRKWIEKNERPKERKKVERKRRRKWIEREIKDRKKEGRKIRVKEEKGKKKKRQKKKMADSSSY